MNNLPRVVKQLQLEWASNLQPLTYKQVSLETAEAVTNVENQRKINDCIIVIVLSWCPITGIGEQQLYYKKVKGKVFPYSLLSVGPGADPGVQAVSPQVT